MSDHKLQLGTSFVDALPKELITQILAILFLPWSAATSADKPVLQPIPDIQVLRTCKSFLLEGTEQIQKSYTGELNWYDPSSLVLDGPEPAKRWHRWVAQHTTSIFNRVANRKRWYIYTYWQSYPLLQLFCVTVPYTTIPPRGPLDERERQECETRYRRAIESRYQYQSCLLSDILEKVYPDMIIHNRVEWPRIEYHILDCRCHPGRSWIVEVQHQNVDVEIEVLVDESLVCTMSHLTDGHREILQYSRVDGVSVLDAETGQRKLKILNIAQLGIQEETDP